ncbi:MAG: hypothetical protein AB1634_17060, partial [Thermodesulfobacteriota bacterium]
MNRTCTGLLMAGNGLGLATLFVLALLAGSSSPAFALAVDCATCHNNHAVLSSCVPCHAGSTRQIPHQPAHNRTVLPDASCGQCHVANVYDQHQGLYASPEAAYQACIDTPNFTCFNLNRGCQVCHNDTYDAVVAAGVAETPVDCFACHNPAVANHAAGHDQLTTTAACTTCHASADFPAVLALHRDDCSRCHSSTRQAVVDTINAGRAGTPVSCDNCHGIHAPAVDHNNLATSSNCSTCHVTGDFDAILTAHLGDCLTCHASTRPEVLATVATGRGPTGVPVSCENCHAGHPSVAAEHNNLTASPDCASCHATPDFVAINALHGNLCGLCHASARPVVLATIAAGQGAAGTAQDCADCHTGAAGGAASHAATFAGIEPVHNNVQADASCAGCHATAGVERLSQHRNDCAVCHASSNATVQAAIAAGATTAQTCAACHVSGGAPFHATTFAGIEPAHNNVQADASCAGCHATAGVERLAQHRNDCAVCHSSTNTVVQAAIAAGATTAQNCAACHKTGGAVLHGTDNASAAAAHDSFAASGNCSTCHAQATAEARLALHQACVQCHTSSRQPVIDTIAAGILGTQVSCDNCHSGHPNPAADHNNLGTVAACSSCHASPDFTAIAAQHLGQCGVCHASTKAAVTATIAVGVGATGTLQDCLDCHSGDAGSAVVHATTFAGIEPAHNNVQADASCAGCHATTGVERLAQHRNDCAVCHGSTNTVVQAAIAAGATTAQNCAACHKTGGAVLHGTNNASAAAAHDSFAASGNCSTCHAQATAEARLALHQACVQCHTSSRQPVIDAIAAGILGTLVSCDNCHGG